MKGWQEEASTPLALLLERFIPLGLQECICTDISRDGMLEGPSFNLYRELGDTYPGIGFTASGGISSMADIEKLNEMGVPRAIVGKAIYENRITLKDISSWLQNA